MQGLLSGSLTRGEVASWAFELVISDLPPDDEPLWTAIHNLAMVELPAGEDRLYLYEDIDFHAWLDDLENAMDQDVQRGDQGEPCTRQRRSWSRGRWRG